MLGRKRSPSDNGPEIHSRSPVESTRLIRRKRIVIAAHVLAMASTLKMP